MYTRGPDLLGDSLLPPPTSVEASAHKGPSQSLPQEVGTLLR